MTKLHVDEYYLVILKTAQRLALDEAGKKKINPVVKVPDKTKEKP